MHFNHHNIVSMKAYTIIVVFDKIIHLIEFTPPKPNQLIANSRVVNAMGPNNRTPISPLQLLLYFGRLCVCPPLNFGAQVFPGEGGGHGRHPVHQHVVREAVAPAAAHQQRGQGGVIHRPGDVHAEPDNKQHQQACMAVATIWIS